MPFEKGHKKIAGRTKGVGNKKKSIVRGMLINFTNTEEFWDKFFTELESLDGKDYVNAAKGIFDIIEPKLTAISAEVTETKNDVPLIERLRTLSEDAQG
jgi:hypothetical protein